MSEGVQIPEAFAEATIAREGTEGEAWIRKLPAIVSRLCSRWALEVDGPPWHGFAGIVVPVLQGPRELALKVSWQDYSSEQEALVLRTWGGQGAVRLLEADADTGALLLERLVGNRSLEDLPVDEATRIAGGLLRRLAVRAPEGLRTMDEELAEIASLIESGWEEQGRPFPRALVDRALEYARLPVHSVPRLLVNQDLHYENVLAGEREPWLVIDPKGLAGDPEFGVAPLLWNRFDLMKNRNDLEHRLTLVVESARLDPERARRWAILRIVDNWIWSLGEGFTKDSVRCERLVGWLLQKEEEELKEEG